MRVRIIHATEHKPEHYILNIEGYRALQLLDESGVMRGELVWRVGTEQNVEITEFGIFNPQDRRQGWGTKLLESALMDIQEFFAQKGVKLRREYLFCEAKNSVARAFYEARGFTLESIIKDFYIEGDAAFYILVCK